MGFFPERCSVPNKKEMLVPMDYRVLRNILRDKIDVAASHTDADGALDDMARKTVSDTRGLCRVWLRTKGDMGALVKDVQQRMLNAASSDTVQAIVQLCVRYMDDFLTHTRRPRGEWDEIASGALHNLRMWFETTGYAMVRERYTASHFERTNLLDVVFSEYNTALSVYLDGIRHTTLCDYELQLILDWIHPRFEKIVDAIVFDIDTERAEQNARELLEEVEEEAPARVSKNKRRKARRRAAERVSKEEDCAPAPPNVEEDCVPASPNVEEDCVPASPNVKEDCVPASPNVEEDCVPASPNVEEITDALSANTVCTDKDDEDETTLCVVCMDAQRTHLIAPCGHKCLCESCSTTFGTTCPICRADAMLVCKVFD
jgi:hypothetical protein